MKKVILSIVFGALVALSAPNGAYAHCGSCSTDKDDKKECPSGCKGKKGDKEKE
ncbi:MAG: hypothetical protein AAGA18_03950 [Verrucomicrobiota bacterium]